MRKVNEWITIILLLILGIVLGGCTSQGNNERSYKDIAPIKVTNSGENSFSIVTVTSDLTGQSEQDQEMGDASTSPVFTAAWEAAQAMGAKDGAAFMKDIAPILEKWFVNQPDNSVDNNPPAPQPDPDPGQIPDPDPDDDVVIDDDMTFATYKCEDLDFTYRDCELSEPGCESVKQLVCTFTDYDECADIPEESFTMIWKDANGGFKYREVDDRCTISMASEEEGYGKFRPAHDKPPYKPVAYAPRYFDAVEVDLVKKQ